MGSKKISDILDNIPSTLPTSGAAGPSAHHESEEEEGVDAVPDSCDDSSDLDEPKAIPMNKLPSGYTRVGVTGVAPGSSRTPLASTHNPPYRLGESSLHKPKAVGTPIRTPASKVVEASVGRGGKMIYASQGDPSSATYFMVQWRKPQFKKHKTWDGDAYIRVEGKRVALLSEEDATCMGTCALIGGVEPGQGSELRIGNFEVEVDRQVSYDEFQRNTTILNRKTVKALPSAYTPSVYAKPFKTPIQKHSPRPAGGYLPAKQPESKENLLPKSSSSEAGPSRSTSNGQVKMQAVSEKSFYGATKEKVVIGEKSAKQRQLWGGAMHDPKAEGAVVMDQPPAAWAKKKGTTIHDVVIDPLLSARMRDHQKEGVKPFMYKCIMGMTEAEAEGCILADEMGLGKTLQTIALVYTLLKQSPYQNESSIIGKALIVCPVSLVNNWKKEFRKWLGPDRVGVVTADGPSADLAAFQHHRGRHVLIIGYERVINQLKACQPPIGLIVCDEGHRLKSKDNKTTKMFEQLSTRRRIILSGTPVQNDLSEYWAMVEFTCPGLLGRYPAFQKHFEKPILRSRQPGATKIQIEDGEQRMSELNKLSKEFVIRRTAGILSNYLPPKKEYVVFVAPSELQLKVYATILQPGLLDSFTRGFGVQGLALIDLLRKVSNTPMLLRKKDDDAVAKDGEILSATDAALQILPSDVSSQDVTVSDRFLHKIYHSGDDKVVIVSNWTSTLNIIQNILKAKHYAYLRLDGSTPPKERQVLVDRFNRDTKFQSFVFLLSAKAGGTGLNLIGANRLVLFDSDWNPSTDLQAMARIHRDGQKKVVHIYRLLTTNTIDEKIYQRQITKTGLSDQMMDHHGKSGAKETKDSFSPAELRDIFTLKLTTDGCQTHDLLGCDCVGKTPKELAEREKNIPTPEDSGSEDENMNKGFVTASQYDPEPTPKMQRKAAAAQQQKLAALKNWKHMDASQPDGFSDIKDDLLYNIIWETFDSGLSSSGSGSSGNTKSTPGSRRSLGSAHNLLEEELEGDDIPIVDLDDEEDVDGEDSGFYDLTKKNSKISRRMSKETDSDEEGKSEDEWRSKTQKGKPSAKSAKKAKTRRSIDNGDADDDDMVGNSMDEDDDVDKEDSKILDSENEDEDDNGEDKTGGRKRKRPSSTVSGTSKTQSRSSKVKKVHPNQSGFRGISGDEKKHNLSTIAAQGGTGKVMFVFEKISDSTFDQDEEDKVSS